MHLRVKFMRFIGKIIKSLLRHYALRIDDVDLMRAQFQELVYLIPILYLILASNAVALLISFSSSGAPLPVLFFPALLVILSATRGIWWYKRRHAQFSDRQIRKHMGNTSVLTVVVAVGYMAWGLALYPHGDAYARGQVVFFLAITQISCVLCLTSLRSAALSVTTVGIAPLCIFLLLADHGHMVVEAIVLSLVGVSMVMILFRQNKTFAELIQSQRDLRNRQLETQKLSDENHLIAFTDPLSQLPNRRALLARLEQVYAKRLMVPDTLAVIFIDLDRFKDINDDHGHQLGDALIMQVGRVLNRLKPAHAMLARMGGDEFAILLECDSALANATALAHRLLAALQLPLHLDGRLFHIGASIGVAGNNDGATSPDELLRRADTAMYHVKEHGKGGVQQFDRSFDEGRAHRQLIERDICTGLAQEEFDVVYQPIVDARTHAITGVEALVRWPRRAAGSLTPDEFIEVAEASGLIQPLGLFVLERACADLRAQPGLHLSVNVSPFQFREPNFAAEIAHILRKTGFPANRLQLEITERNLIDRPESAAHAIETLRNLGISFALDDFGTGFTSIAYLQSYGFACVKIDKSLSAKLAYDPKATMLIAGLVYMASGLDMRVTAEGVETEAQAVILRTSGCHSLQGFLFGRPGTLDQINLMIAQFSQTNQSSAG